MSEKEVIITLLLVVGAICTINLVLDMILKYLFKRDKNEGINKN